MDRFCVNCDYIFLVMHLVVCNLRGSLTTCGNQKFDTTYALVFIFIKNTMEDDF